MDQAIRSARPGSTVGYVGVPNGGPELLVRPLFANIVGVNGGVAPVRNYVEELLADVLSGAAELTPYSEKLWSRRGHIKSACF